MTVQEIYVSLAIIIFSMVVHLSHAVSIFKPHRW